SRAGYVELAAVIGWENQRARLNQALGIRPSGFSDGAYCVRPEVAAGRV
ncbi:MAG: carboxymuconolactone decarboxylase family protein, partial [Microthrixaceae bacterium]